MELGRELKMDGETCRQSSWESVGSVCRVCSLLKPCRRSRHARDAEYSVPLDVSGGRGFVRDARVVAQLAAVSGAVSASQ